MKHFIHSSLFFMAFGLALFSCGKEDTSSNQGSITCTIAGAQWEAKGNNASIVVQNGRIVISGFATDSSVMTINLIDRGIATYTLVEGGDDVAVYSPKNGALAFTTNYETDPAARVIITEINTSDSTMTGTFTFTAIRPIDGAKITLASGKFEDVKFTNTVTNTTSGSLSCKIDGVDFTAGLTTAMSSQGYLALSGTSATDGKGIVLWLDPAIGTGNTTLEGLFSTNFAHYTSDGVNINYSTSGSVNISKHDKTKKEIAGTFTFSAQDAFNPGPVKSITNGSFSMKY